MFLITIWTCSSVIQKSSCAVLYPSMKHGSITAHQRLNNSQNNVEADGSASKRPKTQQSAGKAMVSVLARSDYLFFFPNFKKWLGGQRFANNEEMEYAVNG